MNVLSSAGRRAAGALLAVCVVVPACGGDSGSSDDERATEGSPAGVSDEGSASAGTSASAPPTTATATDVVTVETIVEIEMPDLSGLSRADAEASLRDAGIDDVAVTTEESEEALGTVIDQTPAAGDVIEPIDAAVELVVAEVMPTLMPDLVGSTDADAADELRQLGHEATIVEQDSVEPEGDVLEQSPDADTELEDGAEIEIGVARAVAAPDFSSTPIDEIEAYLEPLGGSLTVTREYHPGSAEGDFVRQRPKAGDPLTSETTIVVGDAPASIYLDRLDYTDDDGYFYVEEVVDLNGERYNHSIVAYDLYGDDGSSVLEQNLGRDFSRLQAVVGYEDTASADGSARIEIVADGRSIYRRDLRLGQAEVVDLDVANVLRLSIEVTGLGESDATVALGEARLLGSPDVIADYEAAVDD